MALLGDLAPDAPEWSLLDGALLRWLQTRRATPDELLNRPGGVQRFIRETGEGLRAVWRLNPEDGCTLPRTTDWLREQMVDLLRWADGLTRDPVFDLGRVLLTAAAHLQKGTELRFLWLRLCDDAATPRLRHRLDAALLGLAIMPGGLAGGPPSHDVIVGLARWASRMPQDDSARSEVVREWRALKATFPRQHSFWRSEWQAILDDPRVDNHPFTQWLRDADPALQVSNKAGPRRAPQIPGDIPRLIDGMRQECRQQGLTPRLWNEMSELLARLERYADFTGEAYYLVTSCTNIASVVMDRSPGQALTLARRALLWVPSDGHAWSVRATALERLGHPDLAEAVLWEALRRVPSNPALHVELAKIWIDRGGLAEAEALLRKAISLEQTNEYCHVELARVLWLAHRAEQAVALLRDFLERKDAPVARYTLCSLLLAEGEWRQAETALAHYCRTHGNDHHARGVQRRIAAGEAGQEEQQDLLRQPRRHDVSGPRVEWDGEAAQRSLAAERGGLPRLHRISRVAEADLHFQLGAAGQPAALRLVDAALADDPADAYAQVVKGLAVPEYREAMRGRAGRFSGSLPVRLALSPGAASNEYWADLLRDFPEGRHLIFLIQLARGQGDDWTHAQLTDWCSEPTRWDNPWEGYLKQAVQRHLHGDDTRVSLSTLAHDALTQAVDVGHDASPLAA